MKEVNLKVYEVKLRTLDKGLSRKIIGELEENFYNISENRCLTVNLFEFLRNLIEGNRSYDYWNVKLKGV